MQARQQSHNFLLHVLWDCILLSIYSSLSTLDSLHDLWDVFPSYVYILFSLITFKSLNKNVVLYFILVFFSFFLFFLLSLQIFFSYSIFSQYIYIYIYIYMCVCDKLYTYYRWIIREGISSRQVISMTCKLANLANP
jgi:hypothetical protein